MNSVILLSGGLDSFVALDIAIKTNKIALALFFDYGQKALSEEYIASCEIAKFYGIDLKIIKLPFLAELSSPDVVWIANRNGLFLNIAGCFCDKLNIDSIVFGANKEEARDFSDNTKEFCEIATDFFKYSTQKKPLVIAPCIDLNKTDIINYAIKNNLPLNLIKSCYNSINTTGKKHCGICNSCKLLYNAIKNSSKPELTQEFFK